MKPTTRTQFLLSTAACLPPGGPTRYQEFVADTLLALIQSGRLRQVYERNIDAGSRGFYGTLELHFDGGELVKVPIYDEGPLLGKISKQDDAA